MTYREKSLIALDLKLKLKGQKMIPIPLCITLITVVASAVAGKELLSDKK